MKREFNILLLCLFFAGAVKSQSIFYLEKNQKYTHHLTKEISAEDEMGRIDKLCAGLVMRLDSFTKTTTQAPHDKRVYYYAGDSLHLVKYFFDDSTTTNRVEWYFEHNKLVCQKHYVRYKQNGKYFTKDRVYFSPLDRHGPFAWIKFDRRVAEGSPDFDRYDISFILSMLMDDFKKLKK